MDQARLNLAVKPLDSASLVEADGELGPWTMEALGQALQRATDADSDVVILDLTRVTSIDVGALVVLRQACLALGPDRKLCAIARGKARTVFEMTRFDDFLGVYPSIQEALESAGSPTDTAEQA